MIGNNYSNLRESSQSKRSQKLLSHQPQNPLRQMRPTQAKHKSKNRHLQAIENLKQKEPWDNRFVLGKITDYQEQQNQKKFIQQGRIRRPPSSNSTAKRQAIHNNLNSNNDRDLVQYYYNNQEQNIRQNGQIKQKLSGKELEEKLKQIQVVLNEVWEAHHIPHNHRELYVKCNKNLQREVLISNIEKEIELLKQRRAPIQNCIRAIKARESCLGQLQSKVQELSDLVKEDNTESIKISIEKISEFIIHQRILSLNVVESILRWRQNLTQSLHQAIAYQKKINREFQASKIQITYMPFIYNNENYLLKMTSDTLDLQKTDLKDFLYLSKTYDPFFLSAQKAKMGNQTLTILHEIKPQIIQRIRAAELILVEEEFYTKIEEASNVYTLQLFDIYEDDLQKILPNYLSKLEQSNQVNFVSTQSNYEQILEQIGQQQEVSLIQYRNERTQETEGLAIIHLDKTQYNTRRMDIMHISTLKKQHFKTMLEKTIEFIWLNDHCQEIRTSLIHFQQPETDKLAADKELTQDLKSFGFKWKSLLNEKDTGKRTTVFAVKRDAEQMKKINESYKQSGKQDEPIQLKSCFVLSEEETKQNLENPQYTVFDNSPALVACLKALINEEDDEQIQKLKNIPNQYIQHLMQMLDKFIKNKLQLTGTKVEQLQDNNFLKEQIPQLFGDQQIQIENYLPEKFQKNTACSLTSMVYRWKKSSIQKKIDNQNRQVKYLRLQSVDQDTLGTSRSDIIKNPVYIIQTDDINVNAFVINLEKNEMDQITTGHFHEFIQQIIKDCQNKQQFDKELWIPAFRKKIPFNNVPQVLDTECYKTCASQIDFGLDYDAPIQGGLKIKQIQEGAVFIRAPFIFGLIHGEIAEALDFPIFTTLVSRQDY